MQEGAAGCCWLQTLQSYHVPYTTPMHHHSAIVGPALHRSNDDDAAWPSGV